MLCTLKKIVEIKRTVFDTLCNSCTLVNDVTPTSQK